MSPARSQSIRREDGGEGGVPQSVGAKQVPMLESGDTNVETLFLETLKQLSCLSPSSSMILRVG
jgi:hypothetical protein